MPKLDSEFKLHTHPAGFIGPVDSDRFTSVLLDDLVFDSHSVPDPQEADTGSTAECSEVSPCLRTPDEMARLLAPDLNGLHRWD